MRNSPENKFYTNSERLQGHVHQFRDCLVVCGDRCHKARYCKDCGKLSYIMYAYKERNPDGSYKVYDAVELTEKFSALPQFHINNLMQTQINLDEEENIS